MKPFTYYTTRKTPYPNKRDYITNYVYDKGKCLYTGSHFDTSKEELKEHYPNAIIQEVMNDEAFKEHLDQFNAESGKLHQEFQNDLFEEFGVVGNPKRNMLYEKVRDMSGSSYSEMYDLFENLVELIW